MKTFIIRARKGPVQWQRIKSGIGTKEHIEVIAHCVMNAFFISNGFRKDVEVYIVLDSSMDFPRTIKLSSAQGLSFSGFHEIAILDTIENALKNSEGLKKDAVQQVEPGVEIMGFGFEKLANSLLQQRPLYLLDKKGSDIREINFSADPVFILSDHLAMPNNIIKSLQRKGLQLLSLGKQMLFASQCIVLIHNELDRGQ